MTFISNLPVGTYAGTCGGYIVEFKVNTQKYEAEFPNGVRGLGYSDAITVTEDGKIFSACLSSYAVALKQNVWIDLESIEK